MSSTDLPRGIKLISYARSVRWFGWGFGETLIPIFLFSFSSTFAEAGLLRATYELTALLTLPLIGAWADKVSARSLVILALILYPLVGISYFFAGALGAAIFIVIARGLNGCLWQLENIGASTYFRRIASHKIISTSFGYIDTWANFWWIIAALISVLFVSFVPIHYLLLFIAPFAIIALFVALRAPKDVPVQREKRERTSLFGSYRSAIVEWKTWNGTFWLLGALVLFSSLIEALMWFFIPIEAFIDGTKPALVVLLAVIAAVPSLFGYSLGKLADRSNKYTLIAIGLFGVAVITGGLAVFPQYIFKLIASFLLGVLLQLFSVIQKALVTTLGSPETYGRRGSAFESIANLGDLSAPLVLGISLDILGFSGVSIVVACGALVLSGGYALQRRTSIRTV